MEVICSSCKQPFTTSPNPRYKNTFYKTCTICRSRKSKTSTSKSDSASSSSGDIDKTSCKNDTNDENVVFEIRTEDQPIISTSKNDKEEINKDLYDEIKAQYANDAHDIEILKYELQKLIESNKKVISNFEHERTTTRFLIEKMNVDLCSLSIKSSQESDYEDKKNIDKIKDQMNTLQYIFEKKMGAIEKTIFDLTNYIKQRL